MASHSRLINLIVILFLLLAFINSCKHSGEKTTQSSETKKASEATCPLQPFGHDFYGANINLGDDERDIKRILGNPTQKNIHKCEHITYCGTFIYPFGEVEIVGEQEGYLYVVGIVVSVPGFYGPRKTQVGGDIDLVIKKFPDENNPIQNKQRKLYGDMNKIHEKTSDNVRWEELGYGIVYNTPQKLDRAIRCMLACHNLKKGWQDAKHTEGTRRGIQGQGCLGGAQSRKDHGSDFQ